VAVAAASPTTLGLAVLLIELSDHPTIIGVVRVCLVEDAESASTALVTLGAVVMAVVLFRLRRENSSLLAFGVLWLEL
jgi:hypothetical protein